MRVLVNAVAARLGGGARHLPSFMLCLADAIPEAHFEVLVTEDFVDRREHPRVCWTTVDVPPGIRLRRLWWDSVTVPRIARAFDVVLSPLNFGPVVARVPHVLFQRNPIYFDPANIRFAPWRTRIRLLGYRWLAVLQCRNADVVMVPSRTMADMLERYLPRDKRLVVAPHGLDVGEIWEHSSDSLPESAARWVRSDIRLLHVGHPSPHKALVLLPSILAAVAERVDNCVRLALTIDPTSTDPSVNELMAKAHELGVADSIDLVGRLDQHQVFAMYGAASVLLFPSRTESFGFPVLEAFATGLPVVTSNLPAFREVGGDLVRVFEIGDTEAATDAIIESLNSDDDDRSRRRSRAAQFSVRRQAETVAGELRRLRGEKP